jgi:hypothetical protein
MDTSSVPQFESLARELTHHVRSIADQLEVLTRLADEALDREAERRDRPRRRRGARR